MNAQAGSVVPYLRKITPKTVCEKLGIDLLNLQRPVEPRVLYDLFGTVTRSALKTDKTGEKQPSIQFSGRFQAVSPDGEVFDSGVAYIPIMDNVLDAALKEAQSRDPKAQIGIALRVAIVTAPSGKPSATGYEFDVQRLIPTEQSADDPIMRLRAEAAKHAPALPAPKKEEKATHAKK